MVQTKCTPPTPLVPRVKGAISKTTFKSKTILECLRSRKKVQRSLAAAFEEAKTDRTSKPGIEGKRTLTGGAAGQWLESYGLGPSFQPSSVEHLNRSSVAPMHDTHMHVSRHHPDTMTSAHSCMTVSYDIDMVTHNLISLQLHPDLTGANRLFKCPSWPLD